MISSEAVQGWLDAYVDAWRRYDEEAIRALFTADATYAYHPYDEPEQGVDAIVAAWLGDRDDPDTWEASYAPALIDGNRAIARGETHYVDRGVTYSNLFELEFDDEGRCRRFVEWYMKQPSADAGEQ